MPTPKIMESIHGHEVIHLIANTNRTLSKAGWLNKINEAFGTDARFHTCSAENMNAGELLDFLASRGKLTGNDDALSLDQAKKICKHGEHAGQEALPAAT